MNHEVICYTDHKPLERWLLGFTSGEDLLLERWALKLQDYPIRIVWRSGASNALADFMSRVQAQVDYQKLKVYLENPGQVLDDQKTLWSQLLKNHVLLDVIIYYKDREGQ